MRLNLSHSVRVGRISESDPQLTAKEAHRNRRTATAELRCHQCEAGPINPERGEIDVRDRPLLRQDTCKLRLEHQAAPDQDPSDNIAASAALNESLGELLVGDEPLPDQQPPSRGGGGAPGSGGGLTTSSVLSLAASVALLLPTTRASSWCARAQVS